DLMSFIRSNSGAGGYYPHAGGPPGDAAPTGHAGGGGTYQPAPHTGLDGATFAGSGGGTSVNQLGHGKVLAAGGIGMGRRPLTRDGSAAFGEAGRELYLPLDDPRALGILRGAVGDSGGIELHVHVGTVIGSDLDRAARELAGPIRRELLKTSHRNA